MNQRPSDGRNTAMSALPSPSKSAATGTSPLTPQSRIVTAPVMRLRMYHRPVEGRNTARSVRPSPS